jgi:hypothetical protein
MQYFVRKELDVSEPINLRKLSPSMKIYAGVLSSWHNTRYYKKKYAKRKEIEEQVRIQKDERLKDYLLAMIYKELDNQTISKRLQTGEECLEVIIQVNSVSIYSLNRVLKSKEFLPYKIERIQEEKDFRIAFPDMPVLIRVQKLVL